MNLPITSFNIKEYVNNTYGNISSYSYKNIILTHSFLQNDFGKENDCALVSILTVINYYKKNLDLKEAYSTIENIAKKYFFSNKTGLFLAFYKKIVVEVFKKFNLKYDSIKQLKIKGLDWTIKNVKYNIDRKTPVLLSIKNDGLNYYKNHTVVIDGYYDFIVNNTHVYMLQTRDNWTNKIVYVDYQKISLFSSIIMI